MSNSPVITIFSHPENVTTFESGSASFFVFATITSGYTLNYQWQKKENGQSVWSDISGSTSITHTVQNTSLLNDNNDQYRVVVSSNEGSTSIISNPATLTVISSTSVSTSSSKMEQIVNTVSPFETRMQFSQNWDYNTNLPINANHGTSSFSIESGPSNYGTIKFSTNTNGLAPLERLRIDSAGNITFSNTTVSFDSGNLLQNLTANSTGEFLRLTQNALVDNTTSRISFRNSTGIASAIDSIQNASTNTQSQLVFSTNNGSALFERLRIDRNGNVGIGTTTPNFSGYGTTNLSVRGNTSGIQGVLELIGSRSDGNSLACGDINAFADSNSAGNKNIAQIQFRTDGTTANNRGGSISFSTKLDNGAIFERLYIQNSGRVGIGTTAPLDNLDVSSATTSILSINRFSADAFSPWLYFRKSRGATVGANSSVVNGDGLGALFFNGATGGTYYTGAIIAAEVDLAPGASSVPSRIVFQTTSDGASSPTERLRIDRNGNVGIGTTNPQELLHLRSSAPRIRLEDTDGGGAYASISGNGAGGSLTLQADLTNTGANTIIDFVVDGASRMTLNGSGTLSVQGSVSSTASVLANEQFRVFNSTSGRSFAVGPFYDFNNFDIAHSANSFATHNRLMTITPNGEFSNLMVAQQNRVSFTTSNGTRSIWFVPDLGTGGYNPIAVSGDQGIFSSAGAVNTGSLVIGVHSGTGTGIRITPTSVTTSQSSDIRLKTNIQNYTKGLNEICQVRPVTYDYNGKCGIPVGPGGISIIAQELQTIFPECVSTYKAKLNPEDEHDTELLNYNIHAITFALINSIKELNLKIQSLETRIEELENKS
ncbi:Intramolecular chaperone auto-processing domain containing protein [uncultured Caudovirales phage]|uniref:Intramolecular chaperone auto-processing domain containing protein n=1 Tax=uncultured Caudovirales phage TaxID=2100421 RepID=A0A6J5M322_9CAUD|nr:Intramolecular chaperone auto-processing domain containing protein [uncultured Caudovirales phage]